MSSNVTKMFSGHHQSAVNVVASAFTSDFVEWACGQEKLEDVLMELSELYVSRFIPIIDEDNQTDVACELVESVVLAVK